MLFEIKIVLAIRKIFELQNFWIDKKIDIPDFTDISFSDEFPPQIIIIFISTIFIYVKFTLVSYKINYLDLQ